MSANGSQELHWILIHCLSADGHQLTRRYSQISLILGADFSLLKRVYAECQQQQQKNTILDQWLRRVQTLLQSKSPDELRVGIELAKNTLGSIPALILPHLSSWCQILIGILTQKFPVESSIKMEVISLLSDLIMETAHRKELYRDVGSIYGPKLLSLLVSMSAESTEFLVSNLSAILELAKKCPSLAKPFAEKVKKICIENLFCFHHPQLQGLSRRLLLELCNCAGKNGCDEQLSELLKHSLGTLGRDMNSLLASVHEEQFLDMKYDSFDVQRSTSTDFVDQFPVLLESIKSLMSLLTLSLSHAYFGPVSLPIEDLFSVIKRISELDDFVRHRSDHTRDEITFLHCFIPALHQSAMELMEALVNVMGIRGRRYRQRMIDHVLREWSFTCTRPQLRAKLLDLVITLTNVFGEAFVLPVVETVLPNLIECIQCSLDSSDQMKIRQSIEQVHGSKGRKATSGLDQTTNQTATLEQKAQALEVVLSMVKNGSLAIPPNLHRKLDLLVLENLVSSRNKAHSTTRLSEIAADNRALNEKIRALMFEYLLSSIMGRHTLHPTILSTVIDLFTSGLADSDEGVRTISRLGVHYCEMLIHPRAPILTKLNILESEWQSRIEKDEEPQEEVARNLSQGTQTNVLIVKSSVVQTNPAPLKSSAVQTEKIEIMAPPAKRVKVDDETELSIEKNAETEVVNPPTPVASPQKLDLDVAMDTQSKTVLNMGDEFSDLGEIEIVDADPDEI